MVPTGTVMNTPNRAFNRPIGPLPLLRRSDVFAGPVTFRAAMCGCGTCSKITAVRDTGGPALEAAVSVTEAGYTALDRPSARHATRAWQASFRGRAAPSPSRNVLRGPTTAGPLVSPSVTEAGMTRMPGSPQLLRRDTHSPADGAPRPRPV